MQDRGAQVGQAGQDLRLIAGEETLHQGAAGRVGDIGGMAAQLDHMVKRPGEIRAEGLRVSETLQRCGEPAHEATKSRELRNAPRGLGQGLALDPGEKAHQGRTALDLDLCAVPAG